MGGIWFKSEIVLQFWEGALGPFRLEKLARYPLQLGNVLNGIFGQLKNKLAITHSIAIKLKEKKEAMVVDCHHVACVCVLTEWKFKKKMFLRLGIIFSNLGKKSPKFHWERGRISPLRA